MAAGSARLFSSSVDAQVFARSRIRAAGVSDSGGAGLVAIDGYGTTLVGDL